MIDMKRSNEKGFSLIEIMIAITVFAIGILAVGKMQITAIKGNSFVNDLTRAATLAQDRMEKLISLPYEIDPAVNTDPLDDTDADGDGPGQDGNNNGIDDDDDGIFVDGINNFGLDDTNATADHNDPNNPVDGRYNIFWNIATDHPINNTKEIRVIVMWMDRGTQKQVSITSMKADII